jgi:hypothetical protein
VRPSSVWRRLAAVALVPVLLAAALVAWAVSSPVGSSPDDDFHLSSIWCGLGDRPGLCEPGSDASRRMVPEGLIHSPCYRFNTALTGNCQNFADQQLVQTKRVNATKIYPPVFYAAMGVFASPHIATSVLLIRIFNALFFVGLGTALWFLLPWKRRSTLVWSWAVTLLPLGIFLITSVNPSGWTITGVGTAWIATLGFFETTGRRRIGLAVLALIGAVMSAGSRADGAVYCALGVAVAAAFALAKGRRMWSVRTLWLPVVVAVLGIVGFSIARQSGTVTSGVNTGASSPSVSTGLPTPAVPGGIGLFFHNLLDLPWLWAGALGGAPLGWLDTPMPALVATIGIFVFATVVFIGLHVMDWRKATAVSVVFAALILIPVYELQVSHERVGTDLQPRYLLPLMILLAGFATLSVAGRTARFSIGQRVIIVVALSVSNAAALYENMARYTHSPQDIEFNLNHNLLWWWGGGFMPGPMVVWAIGTAAFAAALALTFFASRSFAASEAQVDDQQAAPELSAPAAA